MNVCMKSIVLIPSEKMNSCTKNVQYFMHGCNSFMNEMKCHVILRWMALSVGGNEWKRQEEGIVNTR